MPNREHVTGFMRFKELEDATTNECARRRLRRRHRFAILLDPHRRMSLELGTRSKNIFRL